ncbi:hypothetical protein SAMN05192568_1016114 [Methylobacterium pseudosasicola]|uniref:Uncharacterized protein n=1 Tax=Methylobacterium pseudosasicola TaxID=582667 RepID=A0A1I4MF89_9HYPH|nr:hypothetical protein SAMN05192568_1016114 [Methylobacterium pseudosasicola]
MFGRLGNAAIRGPRTPKAVRQTCARLEARRKTEDDTPYFRA